MNTRITLGMLVVLAILAGVVYYTETQSPQDDALANQPEVFSFDASDAQSLTVDSSGRRLVLTRQDDGWHITEPVADKAEEFQVNDLIDRLASLRATRELNVPLESLGDYGLVTAKANVKLQLAGGNTIEFLIGERTPDSSGYYLKVSDRPTVYVVGTILGDDLQRWVDRPPRALPTNTPAPTVAPPPTITPATTPTPAG